MKPRQILLTVVCGCAALTAGCAPKETALLSLSQAHEKFLEICREELGLEPVTRMFPNTFWIYLPVEELFDFKASPKLPPGFADTPKNFSVEFLEGEFQGGSFVIEYDIVRATKAPKDHGYTTTYAESYNKIQNNILSALARAFFDAETAPEFIVLTVADVKRGIETRSIFYLGDFRRYMSQTMPYDEYAKRHLSDTRGDPKIVGDHQGKHMEFKEITWPEFLTQQIVNRVRFKYQRSDFAPTGTIEDEILKSVDEAVEAYDFTNFEGMKLINLREGRTYEFRKEELER
jgi:hypothetical protein